MNLEDLLTKYIPENAVPLTLNLFKKNPFTFKVVNNRATKHGDFRRLQNKKYQITINNNLNKYHFLLTLIHEIAHLVTFLKNGKVKPHGKEWKMNFQHLMLPFLQPSIYPNEILPLLAKYLKNPKASTGSDIELSIALKQYNEMQGFHFIYEIPNGSHFKFKNRIFVKGEKKRTRFYCIESGSKKTYLFSPHAEIELLN